MFATIQEGPRAGELVPVLDVNPPINLRRTDERPNPYATGYGKQIPTSYMARVFSQRWHRVYVAQFSNAGTAYIIHKGAKYRVSW